jgi:hypothetical protein
MAISDTYVLLNSMRHWSSFILNINIDSTSIVICKLGEFTGFVFASMSVWLLALIAFDRMISIVYPSSRLAPLIQKRAFQSALVLLIFLVSFFLYIPMPINYTFIETLTNNTCFLDNATTTLVDWLHLVNLLLVTLVVNNVFTAIMLVCIRRSSRKVSLWANCQTRKRELRDRKFAINSIMLNVTCFVCKMPLLVCQLLLIYMNVTPDMARMLFIIGVTIFAVDNASSLFVNVLVNSIFKEEFLDMFSCLSVRLCKFKRNGPESSKIPSISSTGTGVMQIINPD